MIGEAARPRGWQPDASVFISTASGTNFRPTPRVSAKPRTSFHPSLEVGTSDATAPGRIEIGPEETGSGPTWSPPFQ